MRGRTRLSALAVAALAVAALALAVCGGGDSGGPATAGAKASGGGETSGAGASASDAAGRADTTDDSDAAAGGARGQDSPAVRCPASVTAFVDSLERLRRRLAAGLTYDQYVAAVGRLRARYRAIPVAALPPPCVVAGAAAAERALNRYLAAANAWGECLAEAGCDGGDVEASLQARWRRASRQLDALRPR